MMQRFTRHRKKSPGTIIEKERETSTSEYALGIVDILMMIRLFDDGKQFPVVSKSFLAADIVGITLVKYYVDYIDACALCDMMNITTNYRHRLHDLASSLESRREYKLTKSNNVYRLTDMCEHFKNITDLSIVNISPMQLQLKPSFFSMKKKRISNLRSIWISYCENSYRSVIAFCMSDDNHVSVKFLSSLLRFLKQINPNNLRALTQAPEFKYARYICLSIKELLALEDANHQHVDLLQIVAECRELQGLNLHTIYVHKVDFFSQWENLVELRIFDFRKHPNVSYNFSELCSLQVLHLGVEGRFPLEICNPSLKEVNIILDNSIDNQPVSFDKECISLVKLQLRSECDAVFLVDVPFPSKNLVTLSLKGCIGNSALNNEFINFPMLTTLVLWDVNMEGSLSIPKKLYYLEILHILAANLHTIHFPTKMQSLRKLNIGGRDLIKVTYPKKAPILAVLCFHNINAFSPTLFPPLAYEKLAILGLYSCVVTKALKLPCHFALLKDVTICDCSLGDLILLPTWNLQVKVEIIDWVELKSICDCSGGRLENWHLYKDGNEYEISLSTCKDSLDLFNIGSIFCLLPDVDRQGNPQFILKQCALIDIKTEEIIPILEVAHIDRVPNASNCSIL